jgi:hypothetical protein
MEKVSKKSNAMMFVFRIGIVELSQNLQFFEPSFMPEKNKRGLL